MRLRSQDVRKLEAFLERLEKDVYAEPPSPLHTGLTERMWTKLRARCELAPGARVLDVGCGQGVALHHFRAAGLEPLGITLSAEDAAACRKQGFEVLPMDQSFLDFPDASFDLVWCRHCLEHSAFPYFTLHELHRVLRPGGWLYAEVPAPDTSCAHQTNPNHYSVLGRSMWLQLLGRTGFRVHESFEIRFQVQAGPDEYWGFLCEAGTSPDSPLP